MISVTSKSRYAVVALADSAFGERPVPIAQIAERRGMPVQFLEQLFTTFRRDGLLQSHRASRRLHARPTRPRDHRARGRAVARRQGGGGGKGGRRHLGEGVEALRDVFRSTTIADIARREAEEAGAGMYHI